MGCTNLQRSSAWLKDAGACATSTTQAKTTAVIFNKPSRPLLSPARSDALRFLDLGSDKRQVLLMLRQGNGLTKNTSARSNGKCSMAYDNLTGKSHGQRIDTPPYLKLRALKSDLLPRIEHDNLNSHHLPHRKSTGDKSKLEQVHTGANPRQNEKSPQHARSKSTDALVFQRSFRPSRRLPTSRVFRRQ